MIVSSLLVNRSMTIADADAVVDDEGRDVLVVVAKLSFRFDEQGKLRVAARPVRWNAVSSAITGLRYPRDYSLPFPGTECAVVGTARPSRVPTDSKLLSMRMGTVQKVVRLFGPRVFMKTPAGVRPGPAAHVVATPVSFEHCYGGQDFEESVRENPLGIGFSPHSERLIGTEAYRLEPVEPIGLHASAGCFAPIDAHWAPRVDYVGTFDEGWKRKRAPAAPKDRDPRYHSCVRPELRSTAALKLPFSVELKGFHGDDEVTLDLPSYGVDVVTDLHGSGESIAFDAPLSRAFVDIDERVIELSFIAHVPMPMKWEKLRAIRVLARGSLSEELQPRRLSSVPGVTA